MAPRPYRVIFIYESSDRPGTIVARDISAARREAQAIANAGGTAVVQYIATDTGVRETIAIYRP